MSRIALLLLLLLGASPAQAQVQVALDVQPRVFQVPTTLTIQWTSQGASACTASGGWSGARPTSGMENIAGVLGETTFNLTCTASTAPVTVRWANPTKNVDGTTYSDPKHTEVLRATTAAGLASALGIDVPHPVTSYQYSGLPVGVQYFATKAVNQAGQQSDLSASVSFDVPSQSGSAPPVTVEGTATPPPPTGVVSISNEGYAVKPNENLLDYVLDGQVGTVTMGSPCDALRQMGATPYYAVNRAKYVTWTTNRRPKTVVVQCAAPQGAAVQSEAAPLEDGEDAGEN